jgi:NAD(P)-dependent dehydrogenase (short-subunit alcohol dehydrogenase family)
MNLTGKVAIVTGGASGLGEATSRNFVSKGAKVLVMDLNLEKGKALVEELGKDKMIIDKTDVTSESQVKEAIARAVREWGKIDICVNCAGIGLGEKTMGKQGPHRLESFKKIISVNLIGTFNVLRLASEVMSGNDPNDEGERGVIVNTASVAAFDGQIGQAAYSASKGGIVGMTLPIARDLARSGIRCCTIAPGLFHTPLFDSLEQDVYDALCAQVPFPPRLGKPAEYASMVQSIVENPMMNGETIRLDGAIRMAPR